ncbi:MAG TPA: PKD domain-containing protein [Vicinamibacteria bacterium]|nr:PKD domain-containing protein [Vicinamibacteria bacterium]
MTRSSRVASVVALILAAAGPACRDEENVTAPALSATCSAQPSTGTAPLPVAFLLGVSGAEGPFRVEVSYGDGSTGSSADVPHTYGTAGVFTAAFTVTTATQSARCTTAVTVMPENTGPAPPTGNQAPKAVFKSTPDARRGTITGTAPATVRFNMCLSADPDGDKIYFTMDFDGDGDTDQGGTTGGNCRRDHVYAAGTWTAHTCLRDIDVNGKALHDEQCETYSVVVTP